MKSQGRKGIRRVTKSNQPFLDMPTLESLKNTYYQWWLEDLIMTAYVNYPNIAELSKLCCLFLPCFPCQENDIITMSPGGSFEPELSNLTFHN